MNGAGAGRILTMEALLLIPLARVLVDYVPMRRWRGTLGTIVKFGDPTVSSCTVATEDRKTFQRLARHVERAAARLPIHSKCLPRAMALQWMLGRRGLDARLVIAMYKGPDLAIDQYHAWVEAEGEIILGHCDIKHYRPLMTFSNSNACLHPQVKR